MSITMNLHIYTVCKVAYRSNWQTEYRSSRDLNRPGEPADWPNGFPIFAPPELGSFSDLRSDCEKSSLLLEDGYCVLVEYNRVFDL